MAGQGQISLKRIGVDKTNSRIVAVAAGSAFLVMFCLVASYSLFGQLTYQNKVISTKQKAVSQLRSNLTAVDSLVKSYDTFQASPQNLIGGSPSGNGVQDGSNSKLVLDALPSKYDFPALTNSLERLALNQGVKIQSITGTDDEVNQSANVANGKPAPVEMPFELTVSGSYAAIQNLITALERSIRPVQIQSTRITGDQKDLTLVVNAKTFYQPEKQLNIKMEVVK